jgi:tRNA 2-thiouridine synthesizing protein A
MVVDITPDVTLDCKGLSCPMPMLKLKKALASLGAGQVVEMQGTDPGTKNDIEKGAKKAGGEFLGMTEGEGYISYLVKKL